MTFNEILYGTLPADKIDEFYTVKTDITKVYRMREFEDERSSPELNLYRPPGFSQGINKDIPPSKHISESIIGKQQPTSMTIGQVFEKPKNSSSLNVKQSSPDPQERKLGDLLRIKLKYLDPEKIDIE